MRVPFNVLDEAFVHINDPAQPLTVHIEARVRGRLDDDRVRAALGVAASKHEMARARLVPWTGAEPRPEWQIDECPMLDPLAILDVADDSEIDAIRGDLLSIPLSLYESPPFRARLVHAPSGDALVMSVHHAASDGVGCLRLLQSVLRAYAGTDDPMPDLDPATSRSLAFVGKPTGEQRRRALSLEVSKLRHLTSSPARVAPDGASDVAGYGIVTRRVPTADVVGSPVRRRLGASVNDLLLAAHQLTIHSWNQDHGQDVDRIALHMPINARPQQWKNDVMANLVTGETVSTTASERATAESCLSAIAGFTSRVKDRGPQPTVAFLDSLPHLNIARKQSLLGRANTSSQSNAVSRFADTSVLSNVGHISADWVGSPELALEEVRFSPPTAMPLGVGLGAAATDEWLSLSFRHRHALLDSSAAREFSDRFVETLVALSATP